MNFLYGEVTAILWEDGIRFGRMRCGGAVKKVSLELLTKVACRDIVLLCDGVAISRVREEIDQEKNHVSCHSR